MDQTKIGKFIALCRKEKQLTQAQLAKQLGITDRAVSKWETGKSMPDASIMLELCRILGITVNELLRGEKVSMENYETATNETLIAMKKKEESHYSMNVIVSIIFSVTCLIGTVSCMVCDAALHGTFTWSLIVLDCTILAWVTVFPVTIAGKRGIAMSLGALSIFILPYLYVLGKLTGEKAVLSIGAAMSLFSVIYLWLVFFVFRRFRRRRLTAGGITSLLAIPFMLAVNVTLSRMLGEPAIDGWDILSAGLLLAVAGVFFGFSYMGKRKK